MASPQETIVINRTFLASFIQFFKLYWLSEEKWRAIFLIVAAILLTFTAVRGSVLINNANKTFFDALQQFDIQHVVASFLPFTIGIFLWVGSESIAFYCKERLGAKWRLWLTTHHVAQWFARHKHYHLHIDGQVDNPDQRISEDLAIFPMLTMSLFFLLLQSVLLISSYGAILWGISNALTLPIAGYNITLYGYLFWCAVFFGALNITVVQKIGKKLSSLDFSQEKYGANFRFSLVRAREASEQIALLNDSEGETKRLMNLFHFIFKNTLNIINLKTRLTFCTGFFAGSGALIGSLVALPLFFSKQIQIGSLMQVSGAFAMVFSSFTMLAQSFDVFAQWKSVVFRLIQFKKSLEHTSPSSTLTITPTEEPSFSVNNLTVRLPHGSTIISRLHFVFHPGRSYLLQGASGTGKSVFLRAIAGVWPYAEGEILHPHHASIFFLPQKPYLPISSLQDLLLPGKNFNVTDEELLLLLERVRLQKYADHVHEVRNWQHILSLGEQQLLFLAHILIKKPHFIFLDESTSALDEDAEIYFYQTLKHDVPHATIVSVGHRASLHRFHDHCIDLSQEVHELKDPISA